MRLSPKPQANRSAKHTLREVQIAHTELRALNMYRQENLRSPREILDIAVTSMLGTTRDRPRALLANLFLQRRICRSSMYVLGLRRLGDDARVRVRASLDQLTFALVPGCEDFGRGRAAQDARVDQPREADAGDVA
jgi:hypothetical protein